MSQDEIRPDGHDEPLDAHPYGALVLLYAKQQWEVVHFMASVLDAAER